MNYKKIITLKITFLLISSLAFSQSHVLTIADLKNVVGCWQGTLTYLDYTTNKPFSMSANLVIKRIGMTKSFSFQNIYPKEPEANSTDTISISKGGKFLNKEVVRSKRKLLDGSLEIISELLGEDGNDNKKAKFRFTYLIGPKMYMHKKEVQFAGSTEWILRHEYKYKPCS